jgi:hypothetical protein
MKKGEATILFVICVISAINLVSSAAIDEELHLNIQVINSSGGVETGTFDFEFNISTLSDCSAVVYTNFSDLTTDSRGIVSYYLENVNLNFSSQYWLCYYRDDVLINASKIARTPYSFIAKNVSAAGIINDSNMDLSGFNITASSGLFDWLGSLVNRITTLFVENIDFTGMINGSGAINTTGNITADYFFGDGSQLTGITTGTYNATYDNYALNVSLNYSEIVFDTWDARWNTGAATLWDATFNASFDDRDQDTITTIWDATFNASFADLDSDTSYNATYSLYNQTYNATYDNYALNVSLNYSEIVFDTWNSTWDNSWINTLANLQSVMNASGIYETYNETYDSYALNVSLNYTKIVFDTYNATWSSGGAGNLSWNESYAWSLFAPNLTAAIQVLLNDTGVYETYNATYDSYALNVSRNWTEMTFAGYNATWDNSWINTLANLQSVMNASGIYETYNATYDSYALNVSRNWTAMTFDEWGENWYNHTLATFNTWNSTWNNLWINTLANLQSVMNASGIYETYNETYDTFILNVSLNYSEIVFDTWDARWNTGAATLWDATFNASFDDRDQDTITTIWDATFNASFADLDTSYNVTYDSFTLNVSRNWTAITYDTYNAIWSAAGGGGSGLFRTDGWTVYNLTANVSIGTTTSDYRFQTIGNVNLSNTLFVNGTNGYAGIGTSNPGSKLTVWEGDFNVSNSALGQMLYVENSTGNVGIGTSSPSAKLEVEGNLNVTGNLSVGSALVFVNDDGDMIFRI